MAGFAETVAWFFRSEVVVTWRVMSLTHAVASFDVGEVRVEVDFEQRQSGGAWHVGFNTVRRPPDDRKVVPLAFRIFNGVFQAVTEFVETRQPELVVFVSKDEDLERICSTYLHREERSIAELGYRLEGPDRVGEFSEFTLRRTRPSDWNG
jgi:hypothetical protein